MADTLNAVSPESVIVGSLTAASAALSTPVPGDGSTVIVPNNGGNSCAAFQLFSAAFTGTIQFEGTINGVNYIGLVTIGVANESIISPSVALAGATSKIYQLNISGFSNVLIRCIAYTSGTLAIAASTSREAPSGSEVAKLQALAATINPNANSVGAFLLIDNGSTHDQAISAQSSVVLASGARAITTDGPDTIAKNAKGLVLFVNMTVVGTGSVRPTLQAKDSISGNYFTVWSAANPITTNALFAYLFRPGVSLGSWTEFMGFGPPSRTFRWEFVAVNANVATYSASQELMP